MDTFGGQSGAPVWLRYKNWRNLVVIHVSVASFEGKEDGQTIPTSNYAVRITEDILSEIRSWIKAENKGQNNQEIAEKDKLETEDVSEFFDELYEEELDDEEAIAQFFSNEWEPEIEASSKFLDGLDEEEAVEEIEEEEKPENKFENCSNLQKNWIQTVSNWARQAIIGAAGVVGNAYGRPDRMSPRTRQVLNKHFSTTDRDHLHEILLKLRSIQKAFEEGVSFKCEAKCDPIRGVIPGGYAISSQWFGGFGDVHICFDSRPNYGNFTNLSAYKQTALIIHEVAHRYVGISDQAYFRDSQQAYFDVSRTRVRLDAKSAMNNADSYAYFSLDL